MGESRRDRALNDLRDKTWEMASEAKDASEKSRSQIEGREQIAQVQADEGCLEFGGSVSSDDCGGWNYAFRVASACECTHAFSFAEMRR